MKIVGYLRTSLIEWPGKISSVIFVPGCNFRCPFCHNADLVDPKKVKKLPLISEKEVLVDLKKRRKWIDGLVFSIHGDEPVVVKKDDQLVHLPIKEIWSYARNKILLDQPIAHEEKKLLGVECLTKDGFKKVNSILRHKTKVLYKLVCGPGNYSILATPGHSIFAITKNGLVSKRVEEVKKGEWLLSPRRIIFNKHKKFISVLDYTSCVKKNAEIRQKRIGYWEEIVKQIPQKSISELSREYKHTRGVIRQYYYSFKNNFSDLLEEWIIEGDFIHHKTSKCQIPIEIKLSPALGEFLGYAVAEGSPKRKKGKISNYTFTLGDEPNLAKRILVLYRTIFLQKSGIIRRIKASTGNWQYSVILGNRIIGELIGNLVGIGFFNKRIPQLIFNSSDEVKISFLKALILGDGHERIRRNCSSHEFSLKTGSKRLAADFIFLLKTMGIFSWIESEGKSYKAVVSQNDLVTLGINLGLNLKYSFRTRVEGIPRELLGYGLRGQKRIDRARVAIWETLPAISDKKKKAAAVRFGLLNKKGGITRKGRKLLSLLEISENWDFKEVRKIEKRMLAKPEYVYDLVVKDNHSFVGGVGSLLLHNSGGEPTLQKDLPAFLKKIKKMGFETMIETNGSRPDIIARLLALPVRQVGRYLVNYMAMDFKGPLDEGYAQITNSQFPISNIKKSLKIIFESGIPFELRTTVVPGIHDEKVLLEMAQQLRNLIENCKLPAYRQGRKIENYYWYWQNFQPKNCLDPNFNKIKPFSKMEMERFLKAVKKIISGVELR